MKPFDIRKVKGGEFLVHITDPADVRGISLAVALRGRQRPRSNDWYLTPVRAQKWRKLYCAGFGAEWVWRDGGLCWRFDRPGQKLRLKLHHAIYLARALTSQGLGVIHSEAAV